jgi:curli biogenesis system outer membrane secretion channel CsgG
MRKDSTALVLLAGGALATAVGGCTATMTVRQHPHFYDPQLKTVAVVPFASETGHPKAGAILAKRLASALRANGTYSIVGPRELDRRLREAGLTLDAEGGPAAVAATLRKLKGIQAFVTGTVTAFACDRRSHVTVDFGYAYGGYVCGGWGYPYYGLRYVHPIYRHYSYSQAYVATEAALVRVADGEMIHAAPSPVAARFRSRGHPPLLGHECLDEATAAVVRRLLEEFAVVPKRLKLDIGKTLHTARRTQAGQWQHSDDFHADEEAMYAVLRLPAAAARNALRLTVTGKDSDKPLAEHRFTWSAHDRVRRFALGPRNLAEAAGTGKYRVRLYCNEQFVLERTFEVKRR